MSRWTSWAPVLNKPMVSVDVKQHFNQLFPPPISAVVGEAVNMELFSSSPLQSLPWLVTSSKGNHFGLPGLFSLLNSSPSLTPSSSLIMFASFSYSSFFFFFFFFPCILAPVTVFWSSVYSFVSNGP